MSWCVRISARRSLLLPRIQFPRPAHNASPWRSPRRPRQDSSAELPLFSDVPRTEGSWPAVHAANCPASPSCVWLARATTRKMRRWWRYLPSKIPGILVEFDRVDGPMLNLFWQIITSQRVRSCFPRKTAHPTSHPTIRIFLPWLSRAIANFGDCDN